jgi:D-sedoheptulose 7-phosphate isomerase
MNFTSQYLSDLLAALGQVDLARVDEAIEWIRACRDSGGRIFVFGNGGSGSTASHFACDMVKGASYQRRQRFRVMALTDSLPTLTAYANDAGYEFVFVEQLKNFALPGDVALGISGSGNSPNAILALECAAALGCRTIALTGRDGGKLGALAQLHIQVPVPHMGRIEDAHLVVCHMIAYSFMEGDR